MKLHATIALFAAMALLWAAGCDHDTSNGPGEPGVQLTDKTCLGCHESQAELQAALGGKTSGAKVEVAFKSDG